MRQVQARGDAPPDLREDVAAAAAGADPDGSTRRLSRGGSGARGGRGRGGGGGRRGRPRGLSRRGRLRRGRRLAGGGRLRRGKAHADRDQALHPPGGLARHRGEVLVCPTPRERDREGRRLPGRERLGRRPLAGVQSRARDRSRADRESVRDGSPVSHLERDRR